MDRGLGLRKFRIHGQASCLAILIVTCDLRVFFFWSMFVAPNSVHFRVAGRFYVTTQHRVSLSPSRFYSPLLQSLCGYILYLHYPYSYHFPFVPNCASVFLYQFSCRQPKNLCLLIFVIKTILFVIWKFRNKATFHNVKENSKAIIRYINQDIKKRILLDEHQLSPTVFRDLWSHTALSSIRDNDNLVFNF